MKPGVGNRNLKFLATCSTLADWLTASMANMQLQEIKKQNKKNKIDFMSI